MEKNESINSLVFDRTRFWVQIHDLPVGSMSRRIAKDIGSVVGTIEETDSDEESQEGFNFMRLRINVNILQPLCRGRRISLAGGKDGWVRFKYERFPNICYWCGRLTHNDRECPLWTKSRGKLKEGDQQFGSWIRASTPNPFRKTVIRVEGYDVEEIGIGKGEGVEEEYTNREKDKETEAEKGPIPMHISVVHRQQPHHDGSSGRRVDLGQTSIVNAPIQDSVNATSLISENAPMNAVTDRERGITSYGELLQAQLEDIDADLKKFDDVENEGLKSLSNRGLGQYNISQVGLAFCPDGPSFQAGSQISHEHKQVQFKTQNPFVDQSNWVKSLDDPNGIKSYGTLKRRAEEAFKYEAESGGRKKKHVVDVTKRSAEAGDQPRRVQ